MLASVLATPAAVAAPAADKLKDGWTKEAVADASAQCTEALVQGTWENTKRDQGVDPSLPLTEEFRKQLGSEIAAMKKLCACAVREGAKRYTRAEAEAIPADLERAVSESISSGKCKLER
jgi:hypothetical protein